MAGTDREAGPRSEAGMPDGRADGLGRAGADGHRAGPPGVPPDDRPHGRANGHRSDAPAAHAEADNLRGGVPEARSPAASAALQQEGPGALAARLSATLDYDELVNCMRCGFCQPACPTFRETGLEAASPRGRIALMKVVVDGVMELDERFRAQMDLCLGCRACEPVCPADVKYGHLLEQTREALEAHAVRRPWVRTVRRAVFRGLLPHPGRLRLLGKGLRLCRRTGLRSPVRRSGLLNLLPRPFRDMEAILPDADGRGVIGRLGSTVVPAVGERIARIGMFRGCLMDVLFADTNENTVRLLTEAGFEVVIPDAQTCCGALHVHNGETDAAKELAKRNIAAFREAGVEYIASNAGGCGALLVEYGRLLEAEPEWAEDASRFARRVQDVSRLLLEKGRLPAFAAHPADKRTLVTYQDSCHLRNVMRSGEAPSRLLKRVEGVVFVELPDADQCCGSAGIYNLLQPEMAADLLDRKMERVRETQAHVLVTSNPGCLLQMKLGISRERLDGRIEAVHLVDFLYERINVHRDV